MSAGRLHRGHGTDGIQISRMRFKFSKKAKADAILIAFCLVLSGVLYLWLSGSSQAGTRAVVRINGEITAKYSLLADGTYPLNGGTNTLIIEGGTARMEDADCPDKLCVRQGTISKSGQCITCLPNRITVTIEGGTPQVDIVVG